MMEAWRLGITAGLGFATAALFAAVARGVARRPSEPALRVARDAHALGWAMFATMAASDALRVAAGFFGASADLGYIFFVYIKILATSAAFAGFGLYVLTLWTGRTRWVGGVAAVAVAHAFMFILMTTARLPFDVAVGLWSTRLRLFGPGLGWMPQGVGLALFFLPTVLIAVAYLGLVPRLQDRTHRLRVALVATAVTAFQLAGTVQSNPETHPDSILNPIFTAVLLLAAVLVTVAYYPPRFLRRRYKLRGLNDEREPGEQQAGIAGETPLQQP